MGVIKELMGKSDFLLLGVEFVADRDDRELIQNYSDQRMREFLYGPISDATGAEPNWDRCHYEVAPGGKYKKYSQVNGSRVVVGKLRLNGREIELFFSTKYDSQALEVYLREEMGFEILAEFKSEEDPPRYGAYVLKVG